MTRKSFAMLSTAPLLVALFVGIAPAQTAEPVSPKLTPRLQELLRNEMLSIEDASKEILSAFIAGDDVQVAELAQNIHDSFILRQSMTPADKAHLIAAVPKQFVLRDKEFHRIAAELAEAGRAGNKPLQHQKFGQLIEACSACHAQYATDRFPKFDKKERKAE